MRSCGSCVSGFRLQEVSRFGVALLAAVVACGTACAEQQRAPLREGGDRCVVPPFRTPSVRGKKVAWNPPPLVGAGDSWRYVPAGSSNPATQDNVTIEVTPIGEGGQDTAEELLVRCSGVGGDAFRVPVFGNLIRIRIRNGTGHILRTERAVLEIEDGAGTSLSIGDKPYASWLPELTAAVSARYRAQRRSFMEAIRPIEAGFSDAIEQEFMRYRLAVSSCAGKEEPGERVLAPDQAKEGAERVVAAFLEQAAEPVLARIERAEAACVAALRDATVSRDRFLTRQSFPAQVILPDKSLESYVPLAASAGPLPDSLHIRIYDLATLTDAAGTPKRRAHFDFKLVKQTVGNRP